MRKSRVRELRRQKKDALEKFKRASDELVKVAPWFKRYQDAEQAVIKIESLYATAWADLTQEQREELIPEFWPTAQIRYDGPVNTTRRDMSAKEFEAALERRGFKDLGHAIEVSPHKTIGTVVWEKNGHYRRDRRKTLKRAIIASKKRVSKF